MTIGFVSALDQPFRGPRGRRIGGGLEHTAPPGPGIVRRAAGGHRRPAARPQHPPPGRRLLPDPAGRGGPAGARRRPGRRPFPPAGPASAWAWRRPRWPGRCGAPWACPSATACWCGVVEDASPAQAADIRAGDLLVAAAGRALTRAEDLYEVLDAVADGATVELALLRGVDEVAVAVTFPEGEPG